MIESSARLPAESRNEAIVALRGAISAILIALLGLAAVVFAARRMSGALDTPLSPPALLAAWTLLVGIAAAARAGRSDALGRLLTSAFLVLVAAAATLPGHNALATMAFWVAIVGEECWAWRDRLLPRRSRALSRSHEMPPLEIASRDSIAPDVDASSELEPGFDVLQQLTLSREDDGRQRLSGWLRMPLTTGQRTGSIHVAFCPPFAETPEIEVEQAAGPACRIKTGQRLSHGARLDVKLSTAAEEPTSVLLRFSADGLG